MQRFDVDVQPGAQIEFFLNASNLDFGPTVRFRVRCPSGDSDWFMMGSDPMYAQTSSTAQIVSVYPGYVATRGYASAGGFPVTISGTKFTSECKPEAQVDYSAVELQNVAVYDKRISLVLPYDALEGRPVAARHLEVNLVVSGPSMPAANTYYLNFVE
ncbi:MAG TPA: hypothetical protein VFE61_12320 [Candidatus Sulfotelmatobacter sp.]|nr:hypothetical protein [Candidatus Sulfotelmatobacter sp.]